MLEYDDLEIALSFSTAGEEFGSYAYIDRETGRIYYQCDIEEEECPDDIEVNDRYLQLPHKREFELGKSLALDFTETYLPDETDRVYQIFRSRGAYSVFKSLLDRHNLLERWYEYEADATKRALMEWCKNEGIEVKG